MYSKRAFVAPLLFLLKMKNVVCLKERAIMSAKVLSSKLSLGRKEKEVRGPLFLKAPLHFGILIHFKGLFQNFTIELRST